MLDIHNMFGFLCLKQVISFHIPQPLQLKEKNQNTFLSSSLHPFLPDFLVIFFFCLFDNVSAAGSAHLIKMYIFKSFFKASSLVGEQQQEITSGPARRRYETHRWARRRWKVQARRWTQPSHRSGNSQQQASRCLFAAILADIIRNYL